MTEIAYTVAELAQRWNCHPRTVQRLLADQQVSGAFKLRREWRVPTWAVQQIESGPQSQTQPVRQQR